MQLLFSIVRVNKDGKEKIYLYTSSATDSPAFGENFIFLSMYDRLKGTNIGFSYYFFVVVSSISYISICVALETYMHTLELQKGDIIHASKQTKIPLKHY